jgi:hypothetical protein
MLAAYFDMWLQLATIYWHCLVCLEFWSAFGSKLRFMSESCTASTLVTSYPYHYPVLSYPIISYPIIPARLPPCNILSYPILCFIRTYFALSSSFLSSEQHPSVRYDTKLLAILRMWLKSQPHPGEVRYDKVQPGIAQHAHIAPRIGWMG